MPRRGHIGRLRTMGRALRSGVRDLAEMGEPSYFQTGRKASTGRKEGAVRDMRGDRQQTGQGARNGPALAPETVNTIRRYTLDRDRRS